jgi:glycosyltransferase involved in cell wall biosynthesis
MNEEPLVSVVITTRNRPNVITRAARSALPKHLWRWYLIGNVYFALRLVSAQPAREEQLDY